jgi:hypothetical protein
MLTFTRGSGQYDSRADAFYFDGHLGGEPLRAGIRRDAFAMLVDDVVRLDRGEHLFAQHEQRVFAIARRKFARDGLDAQGGISLDRDDIAHLT